MTPWQTLGVAHDAAPRDVKRAYAALIKQYRPDSHPAEFARIREAYEVVLRQAEWRAAQPVEETVEETVEEAGREPDAEAVGTSDDGSGEAVAVVGAPEPAPAEPLAPTPAPAQDTAALPAATRPGVGTPLEQVQALHLLWQEQGEDAALPVLLSLLAHSRQGSIDGRQDLEVALLQWFFGVEAPPLTLLFEAGRAFDWHRHDIVLKDLLGAQRLARLGGMLAASRDAAYGRASRNVWLRRLLSPGITSPLPWFGATPRVREAHRWATLWLTRCQAAQVPVGPQSISMAAWRRVNGRVLLSADLWFGLLLSLLLWTPGDDDGRTRLATLAVGAAATGALALAALGVRGWAAPAWRHPRVAATWQRFLDWPSRNVAVVLGAIAGVALFLVGLENLESDGARYALFGVLGAVAAGLALIPAVLAWRAVAAIECRLASFWMDWRCTLDRLAFDRALADPGQPVAPHRAPWPDAATRRAARALAAQEFARRARPETPRLGIEAIRFRRPARAEGAGGGTSGTTWLRWGFFALWILVQAAHTISSH
jgi:hypothetical protein